MKTSNEKIKKNLHHACLILITLALTLACLTVKAQEAEPLYLRWSTGVSTFVSGNGHGTFYSGELSLSIAKNTYSIEACMQKRSGKMNGVKYSYSRLVAENRHSQLSLLSYFQYINKASMSYSRVCFEQSMDSESKTDWCTKKFSTAETGVGIQLSRKFRNDILLKTFLTVSYYYHTEYCKGMYYGQMAPVIMFGTAISLFYN